MRIHILGICGTFMGGLALLARAAGHTVSGSDANIYPPMSTQLAAAGIDVQEHYAAGHLDPAPDLVVVGNALSRGNPAVEYMLDRGLRYTSGPQWLADHILSDRWVLAVAGTHGKTTTSAMLAWILDQAGLAPGFLIGGVPVDFGVSARLGSAPFFVVEADEYDSAFFDKRAKFVHYRPRTLVLNNLEYDHADIYPDLASIQRQFHHLVRTVPGQGRLLVNGADVHLEETLAQGCWTPVERLLQDDWTALPLATDGSQFEVRYRGALQGRIEWPLLGQHNVANALAAVAAARHAGVPPALACDALAAFHSVKRRLELRGTVAGISVYDDFAHHPSAIATTLAGVRARVGTARIIAVLEPRSNTMRMGVFRERLATALSAADVVLLYQPAGLDWSLEPIAAACGGAVYDTLDRLIDALVCTTAPGDHIVIMSNGGFGGIHQRLLSALTSQPGRT